MDRNVLAALETLAMWVDGRFNRIEQMLQQPPPPSGALSDELRTLTVEVFAKRLETSTHTIARAISFDLIKTVNIGSRVRIPVSELVRVLSEGIPSIPEGYKAKGTSSGAGRQKRARRRRK